MTGYFYRCEVKGIHRFVSRGRKLNDIIGGSGLIKQLIDPNGLLGRVLESVTDEAVREGPRRAAGAKAHLFGWAAGGATLWFRDEGLLGRFAARWPLEVEAFAPGLELVQVWVAAAEVAEARVLSELSARVLSARGRSRPSLPVATPVVDRVTGGSAPAVARDADGQYIDAGLRAQRRAAKVEIDGDVSGGLMADFLPLEWASSRVRVPREFEEIAGTDYREYLAVVHVDGNGVGSIVRSLPTLEAYHDFSQALAQATRDAVRAACRATLRPDAGVDRPGARILPARPLVIGGDDVVIVCRADRALAFVTAFSAAFEERTRACPQINGEVGLSASAGVAFVRATHPFRMAHALAEELINSAKRAGRTGCEAADGSAVPASMVAFARVSASVQTDGVAPTINLERGRRLRMGAGPYRLRAAEGVRSLPLLSTLALAASGGVARGPLRELTRTLVEHPLDAQVAWERVVQVAASNDRVAWKALKDALGAFDPELERSPWFLGEKRANDEVLETPWLDVMALRDVGAQTVAELARTPEPEAWEEA